MSNIKIMGIAKGSQTQCVACFISASWTIDINGVYISLCDNCCDYVSHIAGDAVTQYSCMRDIAEIVDKWRSYNA